MVVVYCNADSYAFESNPTWTHGGCSWGVISGYSTSNKYDGFYNFDTTGVTIANAKCILSFYIYEVPASATNFTISRITSIWNEGTVCQSVEADTLTWNNQPSITSTNAVTFNTSAIGWYSIDITDMFRDSGSNWFGFRFTKTTPGSGEIIRTYERTVLGGAYNSYLSIENIAFVKTTGNDSNDGTTWETAWTTIDKAAKTVVDGDEVHIEGGTYNAEPASNDIAPVNAGVTGIKYTVWGTAGTGTADGTGTGTVTVEKN